MFCVLSLSAYLLICLSPVAFAAPQILADVSVSAIVPTKVSPPHSKVVISPTETLADPTSHVIVLTVTLKDGSGNPLSDLYVEVSSNRGEIDIITVISGPDIEAAQKGKAKGRTDASGIVTITAASYVPGEATLTIIADSLANLGSHKITFIPLPFPANLTISVGLPGGGTWTILAPSEEQEKALTESQREAEKLVNTGTEFQIPFWVFILFVLWFVATPIALLIVILFFAKIRKVEGEEFRLLKTVAEAEDLNALRNGLKGHRIISRGWR